KNIRLQMEKRLETTRIMPLPRRGSGPEPARNRSGTRSSSGSNSVRRHFEATTKWRGGMQVYLKVWRQQTNASRGHFADYSIADVSPDMSFLEMLDLLNDRLIR